MPPADDVIVSTAAPSQCPEELEFLQRFMIQMPLALSSSIRYSRRCIRPIFDAAVDRNVVANVQGPFVGEQTVVDLDDGGCTHTGMVFPKCYPIEVPVPNPSPPGLTFPQLSFGMATSLERLRHSIPAMEHWLPGSGSSLFVIVTDWHHHTHIMGITPSAITNLQQELRAKNIDATLLKPIKHNYSVYQSHFNVLTYMVEQAESGVQWFGLLDDDTFFPRLQPLAESLGKLDHNMDMYVGALSDNLDLIRKYGYMAYGGAGTFLSAPLAKRIGAREQAARCIVEASSPEGDIILRDCVYRHSKAKLTTLPRLYQQDQKGDVSGFFESGIRPLSLHHWKSWYYAPVVKMATAARFCGDCFLQRFRFGTDTVFSNGYSIAIYPQGLQDIDLGVAEGTWEIEQGTGSNLVDVAKTVDSDWSIGPFRKRLGPDRKKSYRIVDGEMRNGTLRQLYLWKGDAAAGALDEVIEVIWEQ